MNINTLMNIQYISLWLYTHSILIIIDKPHFLMFQHFFLSTLSHLKNDCNITELPFCHPFWTCENTHKLRTQYPKTQRFPLEYALTSRPFVQRCNAMTRMTILYRKNRFKASHMTDLLLTITPCIIHWTKD